MWDTNEDTKVDEKFEADIHAEFNGLTASGKFDAKIKDEEQYEKFEDTYGLALSVRGGDAILAAKIAANPQADDVEKKYTDWVASAEASPNLIRVDTTALALILSEHPDEKTRGYSLDIDKAFHYIAANPQIHRT